MTRPPLNLPRSLHWLWLALGILCAGCSSKPAVTLVSVDGTVTLDGKPRPELLVQFFPTSGQSRLTAIGKTDALGKFSAATPALGPGIAPGEYRISITGIQPFPNPVPTRYASPASSQLTAKVESTGGTFDFPLSGQR